MAEEITYIPYGQNEISQQDLMTNLANGLPSFMQQYKWLQKPKNQEKFLKAYDDITKNLTGATDSSGRWIINVNNIDIDGMSPKDKEIYEHAAYYIQQQMSQMTPRAKEEEKKNENLDKFDFIKSFNQQLLNNYYGGNSTLFEDPEQGWNALDVRGSNGLRGTDKRRERMIEALESYRKGLEGKNFNFEGTSFTDINDANNKIQSAIDALKTSGEEDDLKAFSALGLPYRSYFSNGGSDASGYQDAEGNSLTWQQYNDLKQKQEEEIAKANQEAANKKMQELKARVADFRSRMNPFKQGTTGYTPEQLEVFKKQQANNRKLSEGFEAEDYLRMGAMAQDLTGAVAAWVPYYGTAVSGALGLGSLATNFAADWADDSVSFGDMLKNAGINAGLAAVGMVPGLGLAAKSGKWLSNIAKWTPRILTLASAGHVALSDDIKNSLKKASSISDWNKLTNQDVKNITYALSTVAGLSRGTKGFVNNRKFKPAFSESTEKQYTITTSKGKKTIKQEQVDQIKKLDPKKKEEYNQEVKKILGLADDETIDTKNLSILGKTLQQKGVQIKEENVPVGLSSKAKAYREYLENKNNQVKENHQTLSKIFKTDYDIYKANTQRNFPELALSDKIKNAWNPLSDKNLQKKGIVVKEETPKATSTQTTTTTQQSTPKISKENIKSIRENEEYKQYRDLINYKKKDSSRGILKDGSEHTIEFEGKSYNFKYDGKEHSITINGNKIKVNPEKGMEGIRKEVSKFIQQQRKTIVNSKKITKEQQKELVTKLKELKRQGFLKQGGQINSLDKIIEDFINNNNI